MYLATGGVYEREQELDHNEEIEIYFFDMDEVKKILAENQIIQSMHVTTLFYALAKMKFFNINFSRQKNTAANQDKIFWIACVQYGCLQCLFHIRETFSLLIPMLSAFAASSVSGNARGICARVK